MVWREVGEDILNKNREISGCRKSPCSSSLYKRRHCLPKNVNPLPSQTLSKINLPAVHNYALDFTV